MLRKITKWLKEHKKGIITLISSALSGAGVTELLDHLFGLF